MPKFCSHCGEALEENQMFCTNCGKSIQETSASSSYTYQQSPSQFQQSYTPQYSQESSSKSPAPIILGIIGIIFAILLPIVTYPCSIVGIVLAARNRPTNVAGIVLNVIALLIALANSILAAFLALTSFYFY